MSPIIAAHRHSSRHAAEIRSSGKCGCFYCFAVFPPSDIVTWTDDGVIALCPHCGIDSVVGGSSGFPIEDDRFLRAMKDHWFERTVSIRSAR